MLPEFYISSLESQLNESQILTLKMLIWLLQRDKNVRIERLAASLPSPTLLESRRRHIQRFLVLKQLSISLVWFPIIKQIINKQIPQGNRLIVAKEQNPMAG